jgi:hypothetical protein
MATANDYLITDAELFISEREGAFNTAIGGPTDGTKYKRAGWQNAAVYVPPPEFSNDAGRAGNASEWQTGQCLKRFGGPAIGVADRANFDLYGQVGMRCFGGVPLAPSELVTGIAWLHGANLLPKSSGLQLPSFNAITVSGGASTLWPGTVVNDFSISQQGDADPQVAFSLLGSGKHRIPHLVGVQQVETITAAGTVTLTGNAKVTVTARDLNGGQPIVVTFAVTNADTAAQVAGKARTALTNHSLVGDFFIISGASTSIVATARHTAVNDSTMSLVLDNDTSTGITLSTSTNTTPGDSDLPDIAPFNCLDSRPFLEYTDDIGLKALAEDCRWRGWTVGLNNNHNVQAARCGGDPKQAPGDFAVTTGPVLGAYANKSVIGKPRGFQAEILYLVGSRITEWEKMCKSVQLTNLKFGARGALLDEGTSTYEELSIIIPKAKFNGVQGDSVDGYAAFRFTFAVEFDAATFGAGIRVVNGDDGVSPAYN